MMEKFNYRNKLNPNSFKIFLIGLSIFFVILFLLSILIIASNRTFFWISKDFLNSLGSEYTLPIGIGAVILALWTLAITAARTVRNDWQIEQMNQQLKRSEEQLIVSRKQIELIEKQREASYQPELFLDRFYIAVTTRDPKMFKFYRTSLGNRPYMPVVNVGRAVAKSIEYHFSFDYRTVITNIQAQDNMNYINLTADDRILTIDYNKKYIPINKVAHQMEYQLSKRYKNFVADISLDKEGLIVNFPEVYLELFLVMWLILLLKNDIKYINDHYDTNTIPNFPKLLFHISYKDLGNKIHKKDYSLSILVPEFKMPIVDGAIADTTNNFLIEPKEIA